MFRSGLEATTQEKPVVLSWLAQVEWQPKRRAQGSFEVLLRHLFARLLSSLTLDATDNASVSWTAQVAYAAALPTLLFALYLFPAYHQPGGKPTFWVQASHHFFYVNASFAITGLATVLLSDVLLPDVLDALILTSLPISGGRLLLARVVALILLLGGVLLETSLPGILFFPAAADLAMKFPWHFLVHALAVLASGVCAIFCVCAVQGLLTCCLPRRLAQALSPMVQAAWVLLFTMLLVLQPLFSHLLQARFALPSATMSWFPPFWFLGLYEHLLLHGAAPPAFAPLANTGLLAIVTLMLLTMMTYPVAYVRRTRQVIEGAIATNRVAWSQTLSHLLAGTLLRGGRQRAIFCWISQTLPRAQRTRLLLAFFAALVLGGPAAVLVLRLAPGADPDHSLMLEIVRLAIPAAASLTVVGLRIALRAPVAQTGAWAFRVIFGRSKGEHRLGTEIWVGGCACMVTWLTALLVYVATPLSFRTGEIVTGYAGLGTILSILLTDLFFLEEGVTPFTELRTSSVNDLSIAFVTYFVLLPVLILALVACERWFEFSRTRCVLAFAAAAAAHVGLRMLRTHGMRESLRSVDMEGEVLLPGEIGLRN